MRARLKELALERRRFGYRRLHILLRREGIELNPQEAVPGLPGGAADGEEAWRPQAGAGHAGADDAAAGTEPMLELGLRVPMLVDGRRFRILVVVDDFTRECLALLVDTPLSGMRVT